MRTLVNIVVDKKRQEKQTNKMGHETKSNNHVPSGTTTLTLYWTYEKVNDKGKLRLRKQRRENTINWTHVSGQSSPKKPSVESGVNR